MRTSNNLGKKGSFRQILKSSTGMYESSGSQFFRTTIRPHAFGESKPSETEP